MPRPRKEYTPAPYNHQLRCLRGDDRVGDWLQRIQYELSRLPCADPVPDADSAPSIRPHVRDIQQNTQALVLELLKATRCRQLAMRHTAASSQRLDFSRTVLCAACGLPANQLSYYLKGCIRQGRPFGGDTDDASEGSSWHVCKRMTEAILRWLRTALTAVMSQDAGSSGSVEDWVAIALEPRNESPCIMEARRRRVEQRRVWLSQAWRNTGWNAHNAHDKPHAGAQRISGAAQSWSWIEANRAQRAKRWEKAQLEAVCALRLQALWRGSTTRRRVAQRRVAYRAARRIQARWRGGAIRNTIVETRLVEHLRTQSDIRRLERICKDLMDAFEEHVGAHRRLEVRTQALEERRTYAAALRKPDE